MPETLEEFVRSIAEVPCDHRELGSVRRYWCMTWREYGRDDGCLGERARRIMASGGAPRS